MKNHPAVKIEKVEKEVNESISLTHKTKKEYCFRNSVKEVLLNKGIWLIPFIIATKKLISHRLGRLCCFSYDCKVF